MKGNLWDRILSYMGLDDYNEEIEEEKSGFEEPYETFPAVKRKGKVLDIRTVSQVKMVIYRPTDFDQTSEICDNIKNRRPVIVNMEELDMELARRILDFLSGAVYSLDGSLYKISAGIFLAAPSNVDISANLKDELWDKTIFKWQK